MPGCLASPLLTCVMQGGEPVSVLCIPCVERYFNPSTSFLVCNFPASVCVVCGVTIRCTKTLLVCVCVMGVKTCMLSWTQCVLGNILPDTRHQAQPCAQLFKPPCSPTHMIEAPRSWGTYVNMYSNQELVGMQTGSPVQNTTHKQQIPAAIAIQPLPASLLCNIHPGGSKQACTPHPEGACLTTPVDAPGPHPSCGCCGLP